MNIMIVISDTLRRDYLSCYGNDWVDTSNIDSFAREALVFDTCYAGSFPTIPMRHDLMTGRYCFHGTGWAPIPPDIVPLQSLLQEHGYVTGIVADHTHFTAPGYNYHQGFDSINWIRGQANDFWISDDIEIEYPCDPAKLRPSGNIEKYLRNISCRQHETDWFSPQTMQAAMDWLEGNYTHDNWFLWVDTFDPHEPWTPPPWYADMYDPGYEGEQVIYPDYNRADYLTEAELQHVRALYAGTITMLDRWLGRLIQKVKDLGAWEDTAIFFMSDHGWYHGEHGYVGKHAVHEPQKGWPLYEEIAHIPLMAHIPGVLEPGRTDLLCQPVDLMPTILELAGCAVPDDTHGHSLLPGLVDASQHQRNIAVTAPKLPDRPDRRVYTTIADGTWTLIHPAANGDPELYDVAADPKQQNDVLSEHYEVAEALHEAHLDLLQSIGTSEEKLALREPP